MSMTMCEWLFNPAFGCQRSINVCLLQSKPSTKLVWLQPIINTDDMNWARLSKTKPPNTSWTLNSRTRSYSSKMYSLSPSVMSLVVFYELLRLAMWHTLNVTHLQNIFHTTLTHKHIA